MAIKSERAKEENGDPEVQNKSGLGILPELAHKTAGRGKRSGETPKPQLMPPTRRGARFGPPSAGPEPVVETAKMGKKKRERKPKVKADPAHVAKARELRDRYLEQFNSGLILPQGKYEVARQIEATVREGPLMLEQAA